MESVILMLLLCRGVVADFYRDLGVARRASQSDIKAAYRDAAKKYHPDKNKDPNAQVHFQKIAQAYETLSDSEKRRLYDLHGTDYARVQQQHEQHQQHQRHQEEFFNAFGGGHRRSRNQQPIFSSTIWLTSESYRDLIEEGKESWLLQFYTDGSDHCKEFAPRWEALAGKLPPMVRLARINIDQNFGLVQRYRSFVRCRQNAFFMECTTPAIVLVTPGGGDGNMQAEAFRGGHPPSAEQVYEWVKRSLPESRRSLPQIGSSTDDLARFLRPPWRASKSRRSVRVEEAGRGRQRAKGCIFSEKPISNSLFARHLITSLEDVLSLTSVHVDGGLQTERVGAQLARRHGIATLPAVAVWPDAELEYTQLPPPIIFSIAEKPDSSAREQLLLALRSAAVPTVPLLTAANYHSRCGPVTGHETDDAKFCVLLFVPLSADGAWPPAATHALGALRVAARQLIHSSVQLSWVDARRQEPYARHVLGGAGACDEPPQPAAVRAEKHRAPSKGVHANPCELEIIPLSMVAVQATCAGNGKRAAVRSLALKVHKFPSEAEQQQQQEAALAAGTLQATDVKAWVDTVASSLGQPAKLGAWKRLREPAPPLRAAQPPGLTARLYVWFFSWGWIIVTLLIGGGGAIAFTAPQLRKRADDGQKGQRDQARQQQQRRQQQQQQHATDKDFDTETEPDPSPEHNSASEGSSYGGGSASASAHASGPDMNAASASASVDGVAVLSAHTLSSVLESSSYVLVFVTNAGVASRDTVLRVAAHFALSLRGSSEYRQWGVALLDYAAESTREAKPPLLRALLPMLRTNPVGVLRKGQKLAGFGSVLTVRGVDEWIAKLRMGEIAWSTVDTDA